MGIDKHKVFTHETAVVENPSNIGDGTKIWHHVHIMKGAKIGKNCTIGKNTFIGSGVIIGDNVKMQNNISFGKGIVVEDDAFIGPNVVFANDIYPRSFLWNTSRIVRALIKRGASIGANVVIIGSRSCRVIGKYSMIGAGAVVTRDVPDHALMAGNPAKLIGFVCVCGNRLAKFGNKKKFLKCSKCSETIKIK